MINMQPSASPCIMWPSWTTWSVEDSSFVARWLALIIIPPLSLGPAYGILWLQCYWPFCLWCSPPLKDLMLRNMTHRANDHSLCCVDLYHDPCVCRSTYIYIIKTILQFLCLQQKKRAFSTCSSHFTVISITSVQFGSVTQLCLTETPWIAAGQASLSITNSRSLLKPMSIESVMPSSHLILCCPPLLLHPIPPSIRIFSNESTLRMRWPKYWSFNFSISPSNEHPGLISFRMDWLDLLAVQGTLKSLLQHHSSKASIFQHSAFFIVQLSHPYMTTVKTSGG